MKRLVVAGIGTEVGKTIASAIIAESLKADYWKPIQAGELNFTDSDKIKELISNEKSIIHKEEFRLTEPMSPHAAAAIDGITINVDSFEFPNSTNSLVIELAGGIQVPLNQYETNLDLLIKWRLPVILVVNFYLGSINHTLLSVDTLKNAAVSIEGLLFIGDENLQSKEVILSMSGLKNLGTIPQTNNLDKHFISSIAKKLTFC
jgi:dethiobiotin synthetase